MVSILTALALCLSLCPTWAWAAEDQAKEVSVQTAEELLTAAAEVQDGQTVAIKLTADIDLGNQLLEFSGGTVTLDLGGHTLSSDNVDTTIKSTGTTDLTITNGTVKNTFNFVYKAEADTHLTVAPDATILATGEYSSGICATGGGNIDVYGKVSGPYRGINLKSNCNLRLYSGAVITSGYGSSDYTIFFASGSTGATVTLDGSCKAYLNDEEAKESITETTGAGTLVICSNHQVTWENGFGTCETCHLKQKAVAEVVKDNTTAYVANLLDAFKAKYDGATVTLLDDVEMGTYIEPKGTFTLELNGKSVKSTASFVFTLSKSYKSNLTVNGVGSLSSKDQALNVGEECTLTVNGGTIYGVILSGRTGTINLRGGTFIPANGNESVYSSNDKGVRDLLGNEGDTYYAYYREDGTAIPFTTLGKALTETVTVKKCEHPESEKGYDIKEDTHQLICASCGKTCGEPELHKESSDGTCTVCKYYLKPVQVKVDNGEPENTTFEDAWNKIATATKDIHITLRGDVLEGNENALRLDGVPQDKTVTIEGQGHGLGDYMLVSDGGTLDVENCVLYSGASIYGGTATFTDCKFRVAALGHGTGVHIEGGEPELTFTRCEFVNQEIGVAGKKAVFEDCTFDSTMVYLASESTEVTGCEFTDSLAQVGNATFENCTMNGIYAEASGDFAVVIVMGAAEFTDCTIKNERIGGCILTDEYTDEGQKIAGTAIIDSGTYTATNGTALRIASTGATKLTGGTFSGIEIAERTVKGETIPTTLADLLGHTDTTRYAYYGADEKAVKPEGKVLAGPVTVKECTEPHVHHVAGTFTHNFSCEYCGYDGGRENCTYTFVGTKGTCATCGDALTVTATPPQSLVYDGTAKTFGVTVQRGDSELANNTDYKVTYTNNTGAGNATLTVTVGANQGTYTRNFAIAPKPLNVTGVTATSRAYNGTNQVAITGVALDGVVAGEVSIDTVGLTGTIAGTDADTYTAVTLPTLSLTGGKAGNYTLAQPQGAVAASVTIDKAEAAAQPGALSVSNKRAHTYAFGLDSLLPHVPEGQSLGSVSYTLGTVSLGNYYTTGAAIDGQTLTLPIQAVNSETEGTAGTVNIIIHTSNYKDMAAAITVRSVNKVVPEGAPTLSAATLTYGDPLSRITLSGSMKDGGKDVPGTFVWSSPENRPAVQDNYAAAWVFTPTDSDTYAIVNGTTAVQVLPASIADAEITLSEKAYREDGAAHSPTITRVKLGETLLTADVDYTADIPAGTDAGTYTVTLTGKGNYAGTATASFQVNPVKTEEIDQKDDNGNDLRLEVENGLSTVPKALEGNEKYDTPEKIEKELRTKVTEVMSQVGDQIAVLDVALQYKDENGVWKNVEPENFPAEGVMAVLPYPEGTGATGYTFTVQHLISSGEQAGTIETLSYTLTADGLKCKFSSLSPVAIGYKKNSGSGGSGSGSGSGSGGSGGSGGGWISSTYPVTIEKAEHGQVSASPTNAASGAAVTLTVTPDSGYVLESLTVTDSQGKEITLTDKSGGKFAFTMPGRSVTVKAIFADGAQKPCDGGANCPSRGFTDLGGVSAWYHEAVDYVLRNDLMGGYGDSKFGPNDELSRAELAQIIYNKEGRPKADSGRFTDVTTGWYADAANWAAAEGIVAGIGGGMFAPDQPISRQDLAVMLWRYAGSPEPHKNELDFSDAGIVSTYAWKALCWANENGIVNGKENRVLDPEGKATRAEAAQMLKNYMEDQKDKS